MPKRRRRSQLPGGVNFSDPLLDRRPVAVLDLHRYAASEIESAVSNFIQTWSKREAGAVVHIVTGKGKGSTGSPVLLPRVRQLLGTRFGGLVRDWARDVDGGGFLVMLEQ